MKNKYKALLKNIGIFSIGSFGSKFISFLLLPLYTSVLSTNDFGNVDLIVTTSQLLMPILLLSIQDATLRFSMDKAYKKEDVISSTIKVVLRGTILLILGIIIVKAFNIIDYSVTYMVFLVLTFFFGSINNCFNLYLKSKNKAKIIAVSGIISTLMICVSNIILLVVVKLSILGYMISLILGNIAQFLILCFGGKIHKDIQFSNYNDVSKEMTKYSTPLVANSLAWWVNNASDRYIIKLFLNSAANGVYAIAYKIPVILTTVQNVVFNAWSISAISEFNKDDNDGFFGNNYTIYSLLSILTCSVIILFNIPLANFFYSKEFFAAWQCVPLLLTSTVFNGISQFEGSLFAAAKKTKEVSASTMIGAAINIALNIVLIKTIGIVGAAIATCISFIMVWIIRTLLMTKFIKINVAWNKHIITVLLLLIQTTAATLGNYYAIQIVIILLMIILNRKFIYKLVKKI